MDTPRTTTGDKPIRAVSKLCRRCGTVLHRLLIEDGEDYHITCKPKRPK